jgi:sterol desaturase/sphingolipid hydroxylase (fatty acid hydroxylase superfamily)
VTPKGRLVGITFGLLSAAALIIGIALRGPAVIGIGLLFLVFVPIEKLFALRKQKTFRRGWLTDVTHIVVDNTVSTVAAIALAVVASIPLLWLRPFDLEGQLPTGASVALAVVIVVLGSYWGHRLSHTVPLLWRFHAVHHSIEEMDWLAAGRLHPFDSAFTQAAFLVPLIVLGYDGGVFAGAAVFITALAIFQHANVRLRFPGIRWVINAPQWHHWHHSAHREALNKNFGVPVVDRIFGTAYMPKGTYATEFGISDPVPEASYARQMAYPFTQAARTDAAGEPATIVG